MPQAPYQFRGEKMSTEMPVIKEDLRLDKKYGIAETFTSLQGEGLYTGTIMHFIRFSGCSVGKKLTEEEKGKFLMKFDIESQRKGLPVINNLPAYQEKCTLYDGREFLCDTNFQTAKAMSVRELIAEIPDGVERICLTGGEPLDRGLAPLLDTIAEVTQMSVHIETSGTVDFRKVYPEFHQTMQIGKRVSGEGWLWITVAPKKGVLPEMLEMANEIKLLVDETFEVDNIPNTIFSHPLVWLQPVNYENAVNQSNVKICLGLLEKYPSWRMSTQMHKLWHVR
jgi:organic radical activating enzyme